MASAGAGAALFARVRAALAAVLAAADESGLGYLEQAAFESCVRAADAIVPRALLRDAAAKFGRGGLIKYASFLKYLTFVYDGKALVLDLDLTAPDRSFSPVSAKSGASRVSLFSRTPSAAAAAHVTPLHRQALENATRLQQPPLSLPPQPPMQLPPRPPNSARLPLQGERTPQPPAAASMARPQTSASRRSSASASSMFSRPSSAASLAFHIQRLVAELGAADREHSGRLSRPVFQQACLRAGMEQDAIDFVLREHRVPVHDGGYVDYKAFIHGVKREAAGEAMETSSVVSARSRRSTGSGGSQKPMMTGKARALLNEFLSKDAERMKSLRADVVQEIMQQHGLVLTQQLAERCHVGGGLLDYVELANCVSDMDVDSMSVSAPTPVPDFVEIDTGNLVRKLPVPNRNYVVKPPFGQEGQAGGPNESLLHRRLELLEAAFRRADTTKDGFLSFEQFEGALARLSLQLSRDEAQLLFKRFAKDGQRLNYQDLIAAYSSVNARMPEFLMNKSNRNAGDIIAWTTEMLQSERRKMIFLAKNGYINDTLDNWQPKAGQPVRALPAAASAAAGGASPGGRSLLDEIRSGIFPARLRDAVQRNPVLARQQMPLGRSAHSTAVPSDADPSYVYGKTSGGGENIQDVIAHSYMYEWMENQARNPPRRFKPRYHTKASRARSQMVKRKIQARQAATSSVDGSPTSSEFKLSRFKNVASKVSTHHSADVVNIHS